MALRHRIQRLNVHFNFTNHGTAVDADEIRKHVLEFKPDLYVPEYAPGSVEKNEEVERLMEKGKIDSDAIGHDFADFLKAEAKIIAEHGLPVRIVLP